MNDSELLEKMVEDSKWRTRQAQMQRYHLAKKLGFSTAEAVILQNWSLDRVKALAEYRKQGV